MTTEEAAAKALSFLLMCVVAAILMPLVGLVVLWCLNTLGLTIPYTVKTAIAAGALAFLVGSK